MYNPYNPYAYIYPNQQIAPQQTFQQPMSNIPQQPQAPQSATPAVLQVSTIKQVEQAPVQPGGKALVLVANEPVIAMRTADNMGITSTDYYHIERFNPESVEQAPSVEYVTREEFQKFVDSLKQQQTKQAQQQKGGNRQ